MDPGYSSTEQLLRGRQEDYGLELTSSPGPLGLGVRLKVIEGASFLCVI